MASKHTFTIKPIKSLISRYHSVETNSLDPFAGFHSVARLTNDLNPVCPTDYHLEALEFLDFLEDGIRIFDFGFYDPVYSLRQLKECYNSLVKSLTLDHTQTYFKKCKDVFARLIKTEGIVISFGWSSNGFGIKRGFEIEEILLVAHGGQHNDTICLVERKFQSSLLTS